MIDDVENPAPIVMTRHSTSRKVPHGVNGGFLARDRCSKQNDTVTPDVSVGLSRLEKSPTFGENAPGEIRVDPC